jgi:hypothetical protein
VAKAWEFERTHDTDGDGIYDNSQGTGWVESWPPGMPHQEIYLAALDRQASGAMGRLNRLMGDAAGAQAAETRAAAVAATIEREYAGTMYAFSRGADGILDKTATIYPTVAWWDGHYSLRQPDAMFSRWASHEFSTDWGTRDLGKDEALYDPISYHQGSVWPLFTGWASVAEYRSGRPLSGYAHLMQNAELTWQQDIGAVTELLSGDYFAPFGRSTTHQLWSSAMVLTPAIRGLFGLSFDAEDKAIVVDPHLPATWQGATLHHVPVAGGTAEIGFRREGAALVVTLRDAPAGAGLRWKTAMNTNLAELRIPLAGVEVGIPAELPLPGAATSQLKVIGERHSERGIELELEALGGAVYDLPMRLNGIGEKQVAIEGGEMRAGVWGAIAPRTITWWAEGGSMVSGTNAMKMLSVKFPAGSGYQRLTVRVKW